jgi:phage pi2 protein 07
MKDLKEKTGYSEDWLKENILLHPHYKPILDIENGGFVYYPEKKGERWCFIASRMEEFLEKHFRSRHIHEKGHKGLIMNTQN